MRSVVIHKINNIIFDAEIGKYNNYISNIEVNKPSMVPSPFSAHLGINTTSNYSYRSYNSQINVPSSNSNYNNYCQGPNILRTDIPSPNSNSNYSCDSYSSQTNLASPVPGTMEDQTSQNNLTPLQALVQSFDPSNTNI